MKKSTDVLKHTLSVGAILTCGALLIGCAGKGPKSAASIEPETTPQQTVQVELQQPTAAVITAEQPAPESAADTELKDTNVIAALDSDAIEMHKPEQLVFQFGFDKSELGEEDKDIIKQHAQYLKTNPELMVKVVGHTDHHGPKAYNEYLSKKRAEAVTAILIAEGVLESQIEIKAMANDSPLETAQRARDNRRVELQFEEMNLVSNK